MTLKGNFVNRDKEVSYFSDFLDKLGTPIGLSIWGLPGVGKSALIRLYATLAEENGYNVYSLSLRGETFVSLFTHRLGLKVDPMESTNPDILAIDRFLEILLGRSALFIDDYPENSRSLDDISSHIIEEANRRQKSLLLVTSSRNLPLIKGANDLKIDGLELDAVKLLIAQSNSKIPGWISETLLYPELIYDVTKGIPQLIRIICTNPNVWNIVKNQPQSDVLAWPTFRAWSLEIWKELESQEKNCLYLLTAISAFESEVNISVCKSLIPDSSVILNILLTKSLIEQLSPTTYKLHDLIRRFIFSEFNQEVLKFHELLGDYYVTKND